MVTKTVHLNVDRAKWIKFRQTCLDAGTTVSKRLSDYVEQPVMILSGAQAEKLVERKHRAKPEITPQSTNPEASDHVHKKNRVGNGGVWFCECGAISMSSGMKWAGGS